MLHGMATEPRTTGRESDKFMLRFPEGMRARITEAARGAGRSMNAEIISRLESTFDPGLLKESARAELVRLVNEAVDERLKIPRELARND